MTRREAVDSAIADSERGAGDVQPVEVPTLEIELYRLADSPRPSDLDFAVARAVLDENMMPVGNESWSMVRSMIERDGWSAEQLRNAVEHVLRTKTWVARGEEKPRWQIGDLFKAPVVKVYGYHWYTEQVGPLNGSKHNDMLIGRYRVEGFDKPLFGWKQEVGNKLPAWELPVQEQPQPEAEESAASVAAASAVMDEMTHNYLQAQKRLGVLEEELGVARRKLAELEAVGGALDWRWKYEQETVAHAATRLAADEDWTEVNLFVKRLFLDEGFFRGKQAEYRREHPNATIGRKLKEKQRKQT